MHTTMTLDGEMFLYTILATNEKRKMLNTPPILPLPNELYSLQRVVDSA